MKHSPISEFSVSFLSHISELTSWSPSLSHRVGLQGAIKIFWLFYTILMGLSPKSLSLLKHLWLLLGQDLRPEGVWWVSGQNAGPWEGLSLYSSLWLHQSWPGSLRLQPNKQPDRAGRCLCSPTLTHYKLEVLCSVSNLSSKTAGKLSPPTNKLQFPPLPSPPFLAPIKNSNNVRLQTHS